LKDLNNLNASGRSAWSEQEQRRKQTLKKLAVYFPFELQVTEVSQGPKENKLSSHMFFFFFAGLVLIFCEFAKNSQNFWLVQLEAYIM